MDCSKKKGFYRCGVYNCPIISRSHPQYTFFTLPANEKRRAIWLQKMQRTIDNDTPRLHVCEKHFEVKYMANNGKRRRLKKAAVPTLFLPNGNKPLPSNSGNASLDSVDITDSDETTQSDNLDTGLLPVKIEQIDPDAATSSSHINDTPAQHNLNEIFKYEQPTKVVKIKEENDCLTVFVDEDNEDEYQDKNFSNLSEYVTALEALPEIKKKSNKRKYSTEYKMFALDLYFKCPNAYRLLQTAFSLPRISTIYRLCIPKASGIDQDVLRALSIKIDGMTPAQKQSVLCIGTINLASTLEYDEVHDKILGFHDLPGVQRIEAARHVLVVMVRGLFHNWKQTVGFSFVNNFENYKDINLFIDEIIRKLLEIGLNVRALMSDLESDWLTAVKERALSAENPFFCVDNKKIYFMYDTLHLMRNIRDSFLTNNIMFNSDTVAKWHHVLQLYDHERKKSTLRLAPKLSECHIKNKLRGARENLKLTTEIFSRETATAISAYIDLKMLPFSAEDTMKWILTMSKLIDMLNFSTEYPSEDKNAVFSGESSQIEFLEEMLFLFSNLRLSSRVSLAGRINESKYMVFKQGFILTINSILLLYGALKRENCWLPIVGLSNVCLDDFFEKVQQKHHRPTAKQVVMCITKFPIFNIFQYSSKRRASNELEIFLSRARQMADINMYDEVLTDSYIDLCGDASTEFQSIALPNENKIKHLALYLLYKGYENHRYCTAMKNYVCSKDIIEKHDSNMSLVGYRTYENKIKLVSQEFVHFVELLEFNFKEYFKENRITDTIAGLQRFTRDVQFDMPCECFPIHFIKQLFFRYRLYGVLKYNSAFDHTGNCNLVINDL